jgi:hypothetical protein
VVTLIDAMVEAFFELLAIIIAYFVIYLPSIALSLSVLIIGLLNYHYGKKKNNQLMDYYLELFKKASGNRFKGIKIDEESTIGRTYLLNVKSDESLEDFRLHFTMVQRHLFISRIISKLRKRQDYGLLEAEPRDKVVKRYQLEILAKNDEKRIKTLVDMLGQLNTFEVGNKMFEDFFIVRVNDSDFFNSVFKRDQEIIKNIYAARNSIVRISYYPLERPSVRLVTNMDNNITPKQLYNILFKLTSTMAFLGKKGFYTKQRTVASRIVKDITLEKDKSRFSQKKRIE